MTRIDAPWLSETPLQTLFSVLKGGDARAWLVGGCVRNTLLGLLAGDIDIATDARPEETVRLVEAAGLKAVPTGFEHGTVTVIVDGHPFEVTTLRRDVRTDGRHAVVAFGSDVVEDARRRDFTMNALYAEADGTVIDPIGGLPDLEQRRVRFIGEAAARIREDYLRSLRYFRFHALYGDASRGLDPEALAAIAAHLDGLQRLSRERIGAEVTRLLSARDPAGAVGGMVSTGVMGAILPGLDARALGPLVHLEEVLTLAPFAPLRMASLGPADRFADLRLSKAQLQAIATLRAAAEGTDAAAVLGYRLGSQRALQTIALRHALLETRPPETARQDVRRGEAAVFPVRATDLMPRLSGPALGAALTRLEEDWIAEGFAPTKTQLLARIG